MKKITHRLILIINLLVAAALLFSYLAPFINPSKFMLPALFGLAYPYLLILNVIFIGIWLIRLDKAIVISVAVVFLGWYHLANLLPLNGKGKEIPENVVESRSFKVLSYNIRGFDRYNWSKDPDARGGIFEYLRSEEPDIVCFQEFYISSGGQEPSIRSIKKEMPFVPHRAIYFTGSAGTKSGAGIATYSAFPILKRSRIPFNDTRNAAMYTDHLLFGDTLRVFNIHLQSIMLKGENYAFMDTARLAYNPETMQGIRSIGSRLKTAFILRSEQATMIANYIKDSPHPVVVMGDFNDTPQSFAYRKIRKGLKDAYRKAGHGFGNTYAGELPSFRIDHIMVQEPLLPYRFTRDKNDFSDHFPISTWLNWPEEQPTEP